MFYFTNHVNGKTAAVCGENPSEATRTYLKSIGKPNATIKAGTQVTIHHDATGQERHFDIIETN